VLTNHEAGRYRAFASTEDQTNNEQPCKILARGMRAQCDGPYKDVQTVIRRVSADGSRDRNEFKLASSTSQPGSAAGLGSAGTQRQGN
jgi:hypothetical protein